MKRIATIALTLTLLLGVCGCQGSNDKTGEIKDVKSRASEGGVKLSIKEGGTQFTPQSTDLDYEWKRCNIGRAMLSIPYPKGWAVQRNNNYDITFTAPADDKYFPYQTVAFHSTLEAEQIVDIHDLEDRFEQQLQEDHYTFRQTYYTLTPSSETEDYIVDTRISDPAGNLQIAVKDDNASLLARGSQEPSRKYYHQANYFYWQNFPCVLSGVTQQDNRSELSDLLAYMMSNAKVLNSELSDLQPVTVFNSTSQLTFPMSCAYNHIEKEPEDIFTAAEGFVCPSKSESGYAQSALVALETPTENFHMTSNNFDNVYKPVVLKNIFGSDLSRLKLSGYMKHDDGYVDFNGTRTTEYVYCMTVNNSYNPPDGYFYGQQWELIMYPVEHDGMTDLICLCATSDGMMWAFDNIRNMAKKLEYK